MVERVSCFYIFGLERNSRPSHVYDLFGVKAEILSRATGDEDLFEKNACYGFY